MPFKVKLGVVGFVLVVLLTIILMVLAVGPMATVAENEVITSVRRGAEQAPRSQRLYSFDLLAAVKGYALRDEFRKGIQEAEGKPQRAAVYDAIDELDKQLAAQNKKPGFFGVVNAKGLIIARDLDPNADHGDKLEYALVDEVLKSGRASTSIWLMKNRMMRAAVAPIIINGHTKGAVALADDFTAAEARDDQRRFGAHVAYFMGSAVRASSFTVSGDPKAEDAEMVSGITKVLVGEAKKAMAANKVSEILDVEINGEQFKAIVGPLQASVSFEGKAGASSDNGFVVLASVDAALAPARRARYIVLAFGLLVLLLVLGAMWIVADHFVKAEDKLELGVNEMINGNLDYTFEVLGEFEGLCNALNVLISRLLGRPEPGEEEEGEEAWRADVIFVEELGATSPGPEFVRQLAAEPEDAYFGRVFQEYMEARKKLGLPVEGITVENLTRKLRANEAMLKAKHKCQMVRFVVSNAGGKVSFQPVRIG